MKVYSVENTYELLCYMKVRVNFKLQQFFYTLKQLLSNNIRISSGVVVHIFLAGLACFLLQKPDIIQ